MVIPISKDMGYHYVIDAHCPAISKIICWGSQQFMLIQQYACPTFTQCHAFTHSTQWVTPGDNIEWYSPSWFLMELVIHPSSCGQHKLSQHKRVKDGHFWMLFAYQVSIISYASILFCCSVVLVVGRDSWIWQFTVQDCTPINVIWGFFHFHAYNHIVQGWAWIL